MQRVILLLLLFFQLSLYAIHPIQLSVQLRGSYTPFLFEYAGAYSSKIGLTVVVTDNSINNYPVRLEVMIKDMSGTIIAQTTTNPIVPPIFINAGSMEYLDGSALAEYFLARNLTFTRLDRNYFTQNNRLPDGVYQFGFRLVDTRRREVILSNTVWTMPAPFILNQPPELYTPANNTELQPQISPNIRFEWMPKHIGSQNANFITTYRLELFPLRVDGINPEQYVRSVEPEYTATSNSRSLILDKSAFNFETGMSYAWRVQATTNQEVSLFQNEGYSTVFLFNYGNPCPVPEHIDIQATDTIGAIITWDDNPLHTSYLVQYSAGWIDPKVWHPVTGNQTQVRLSMGMEEKKSYTCRVKAACRNKQSQYSREYIFTTKNIERTTPDFQCGTTKNATDTSKSDVPITNLRIGSVIYDGDFPVEITKISKDGNKYTGEGLMTIPMLANAKVRMTFSNITVNQDKKVLTGRFISVYDPNSKMIQNDASKYFVAGNDVGEVITGEDSAAINLNYELSTTSNISITNNSSTSTIVTIGQDSYTVAGPKEGGSTIIDSKGTLYKVQENGTTSKVGTSGGAFNNESYSANYTQWNTPDREITASFSNADQLWAFDQYDPSYAASNPITREYQKFGDNYVANKLIPEGKWGTLKVTLSKTTDINIDSIVFKTPNGTEYEATCKDKECTLTVVGGRAGDAQEVYALYPKADSSYRSFGKIKVETYTFIEKSVIIVPVGDEPELTETTKEGVQKLYLHYAVTISLEVADNFAITTWDTDNDGLDADSSGMFSVYSTEMKTLISLYKNQHTISEQSMYLFLLNKINGTKGDLLGDMPVGYQFGFIKSGSGTVAQKTIAHELAHGMLQLEHTFDEITKSTTTNLMDYKTDGLTLVKHQWDAIHDPQVLVFKALQGDEEGEFVLPCFGVFDDCDDVLAILKLTKENCSNSKKLIIKGQDNVGIKTLKATNIEVDENEYSAIRIIFTQMADNYSFNPCDYKLLDQKFFNSDGSTDWQKGFAFYKNEEVVFKILVDDDDEKIDTLKEYLFGNNIPVESKPNKIQEGLTFMEQFLGNDYEFGGGASRTSMDAEGTDEMDCSEFVCRFIQKACDAETVPAYNTASMVEFIEDGNDYLQFISGSKSSDFKDIQPGDIFLWRTTSGGHTGVVVSYDSTSDQVTVMEAIGNGTNGYCSAEQNSLNSTRNCGEVVTSIYTRTGGALAAHSGWKGYFRPILK